MKLYSFFKLIHRFITTLKLCGTFSTHENNIDPGVRSAAEFDVLKQLGQK
jgi:hypothetical protein